MLNTRKGLSILFFFACAAMATFCSYAEQAEVLPAKISHSDGRESWMLLDKNHSTKSMLDTEHSFTIHCEEAIASLYLVWDRHPGGWKLLTEHSETLLGNDAFIHEFITLDTPVTELTIQLNSDAVLCDIYPLGPGATPDWAQHWQPPLQKADFLLLPTHADDEHLFFGGIMSKYIDSGHSVQVAYMVNHNTEPYRPHELLNGLWAVGIKNYPVIPSFPDVFSDSLAHAKTIYPEQEIISYQVDLIRRFRPQVIVGHDLNGEYGHGAHMLNAHSLLTSVELADEYHRTPKLYLHLYGQNEVFLDYDIPLKRFDGKTAFEMAVLGFSKHLSQQTYFQMEKAGPYDCRKFGLARTTVGPDQHKDDLFENLLSYAEQDSLSSPAPFLPSSAGSAVSAPNLADDLPNALPDALKETIPSVTPIDRKPFAATVFLSASLILTATLLFGKRLYLSKKQRKGDRK